MRFFSPRQWTPTNQISAFWSTQYWDNEASRAPNLGWRLNSSRFGHVVPGCTQFLQSFLGYETRTENITFCTGMNRISKIFRGEWAHRARWIYERTISNTLSKLILDSTSMAQIRSPAQQAHFFLCKEFLRCRLFCPISTEKVFVATVCARHPFWTSNDWRKKPRWTQWLWRWTSHNSWLQLAATLKW